MSDEKPKKPDSHEPDAPACPPKPRKEIPLISVPDDRDMIAEEMADLFNEDKVRHKHGGTEPEAD